MVNTSAYTTSPWRRHGDVVYARNPLVRFRVRSNGKEKRIFWGFFFSLFLIIFLFPSVFLSAISPPPFSSFFSFCYFNFIYLFYFFSLPPGEIRLPKKKKKKKKFLVGLKVMFIDLLLLKKNFFPTEGGGGWVGGRILWLGDVTISQNLQ